MTLTDFQFLYLQPTKDHQTTWIVRLSIAFIPQTFAVCQLGTNFCCVLTVRDLTQGYSVLILVKFTVCWEL